MSSSQGTGGKSQAQAQVEVNEKTGGTSASGQTSGLKHTSQSEVTANEKGGLADAQSSGPGEMSLQFSCYALMFQCRCYISKSNE